MKNILKLYLVAFLLFSDFVVFAQPGDDDDGGGGDGGVEGGGDPQPAPINAKLILLLIVGVMFVFYTYKKNRRTT